MAPITNPLEIAGLLAALLLPLGYMFCRDERERRAWWAKNPDFHRQQRRAARRRLALTLCCVVICGAAIWGINALSPGAPWLILAAGWQLYVFLAFPILCGLFAYCFFATPKARN